MFVNEPAANITLMWDMSFKKKTDLIQDENALCLMGQDMVSLIICINKHTYFHVFTSKLLNIV